MHRAEGCIQDPLVRACVPIQNTRGSCCTQPVHGKGQETIIVLIVLITNQTKKHVHQKTNSQKPKTQVDTHNLHEYVLVPALSHLRVRLQCISQTLHLCGTLIDFHLHVE
jgi:hypothetical protein